MSAFKPSPYQQAIYDFVADPRGGSAMVEAVAGSGKTTTIVGAAALIPTTKAAIFLAFSKPIAEVLKKRLPEHIEAKTINSLAAGALRKRLGRFMDLQQDKTRKVMAAILSDQDRRDFGDEVKKLVSLAKAHGVVPGIMRGDSRFTALMDDTRETWQWLIDRFDIDIREYEIPYVLELVKQVLIAGLAERKNKAPVVDFDDQLYMTIVFNFPVPQYDWVIVDEVQDVNPIQRELLKRALKPGGRFLGVGDSRQAIFGFRGSSSASMEDIARDFNCRRLPLSISYRCPKNVVEYAREIVDHIEASPTAIDGEVLSLPQYDASAFQVNTDMILCRLTAPLVALAYRLLAKRVPVIVMGKQIGTGLIKLIDKLKPKGLRGEHGLVEKLDAWKAAEVAKLIEQDKEDKIDTITDKFESLMTFINESGVETVPALKESINSLFGKSDDDSKEDIKGKVVLCTAHRSKGLEAERVFILDPDLMPSPRARQSWQQDQERNLEYVARTRATKSLFLIRSEDFVTKKLSVIEGGKAA